MLLMPLIGFCLGLVVVQGPTPGKLQRAAIFVMTVGPRQAAVGLGQACPI